MVEMLTKRTLKQLTFEEIQNFFQGKLYSECTENMKILCHRKNHIQDI